MLERMEELLRAERMLPRGSRVLCAVSGGADSVCLLAGLYRLREKLGFTLAAAHYNHNLRGMESRRDEDFVRELVKDRFPGVELYVGGGDVAQTARARGAGLEETARALRYAFLEETAAAAGCDRIATAHTAGDNAETVLLHLARGTGLQGLTGIAPVRGGLIRPLLTTTRAEVEAFLEENHLPHVEDSSNSDDIYARNRVRHRVVPVLEELYPGFARRLTENAASLREDEAYLSRQAEELAKQARPCAGGLMISVSALNGVPRPIALRAVRRLFAEVRGGDDTCAAAHLDSVLRVCAAPSPSGEAHLPGGLVARREYEKLILCVDRPEADWRPVPLAMPGVTRAGEWEIVCAESIYSGESPSPFEVWLSFVDDGPVFVRSRKTGDTLKLPGRPGKTVKKWLVEEKIPRQDRDSLPVLTVGDRVCAVARLGPDAGFLPQAGAAAWHLRFVPPEQCEGGRRKEFMFDAEKRE